jgi:hypothetical protein
MGQNASNDMEVTIDIPEHIHNDEDSEDIITSYTEQLLEFLDTFPSKVIARKALHNALTRMDPPKKKVKKQTTTAKALPSLTSIVNRRDADDQCFK